MFLTQCQVENTKKHNFLYFYLCFLCFLCTMFLKVL
nr:MAG TPA: hypothetical protein [Caudoviricetes sp.]